MTFNTNRAIELLKLGSGLPNAYFREGQEEAIRHVVEDRCRLLVVQKTGWGKSFVYFIATKLLREAGAGPALLISPLLALMRNQIAAAERMGVRAVTINSDNQDEWANVEATIQRNEVDILLISPERLANERFRTRGAGRHRRADRFAGDRRGALHLGLGTRFPPALSLVGTHRAHIAARICGCWRRRRQRTTE